MRRSVLATCVASAALVAVTGYLPHAALALAPLGRHVPSAQQPAQQSVPHPEPRHSAEDVVGFQLAALRANDVPIMDAGIAIVFSFSSPANRAVTGPLARFADLVKSAPYRPLLRHQRATREPMRVDGNEAAQQVMVIAASGEQSSYLFTLSRQPAASAYAGCWMTDGVVRVLDRTQRVGVRRVAVAGEAGQ